MIGEFDDATSQSAFLDLALIHGAGSLDLVIALKDFGRAASTSNQKATAGALDSLQQSGGQLALYNALLLLNAQQARAAFDQLSGEGHASASGALVQGSSAIRDVISNRIRAAFGNAGTSSDFPIMAFGPGGPRLAPAGTPDSGPWAQVSGNWASHGGDGNAARSSSQGAQFLAGADGMLGGVRLGAFAGYGRTDFSSPFRSFAGAADSWFLGAYGGTKVGALSVRAGFVQGWHNLATTRTVSLPGFSDRLEARYGSRTTQLFGELGYAFETAAARFEPFVGLSHLRHRTGAYSETGGAAALSAASASAVSYTTLGLRAETSLSLGGTQAKLHGMLGWQHAFGDVNPATTHAFAGGNGFTVTGSPIARNAALFETGLDVKLTPTASLGLSYQGRFASGGIDHGARASCRLAF